MADAARRARDEWIAYRCQRGEAAGFELLVSDMEHPLFCYIAKLIGREEGVLDVLQDVWIKVFRTVGSLREPAALRTWVYRIARGTALNHVRGQARTRAEEPLEDEVTPLPSAGSSDPSDALDVQAALDRLDRRYRDVLVLLFVEGFTIDEIATVIEVPPGTVKSRIHQAKRALAAAMGLPS